MTAELQIPDRAVRATYGAPFTDGATNKSIRSVLKSGGPIVVAAELRRLIGEIEQHAQRDGESKASKPYRDAREMFVARLRVRARELDPQGGKS